MVNGALIISYPIPEICAPSRIGRGSALYELVAYPLRIIKPQRQTPPPKPPSATASSLALFLPLDHVIPQVPTNVIAFYLHRKRVGLGPILKMNLSTRRDK